VIAADYPFLDVLWTMFIFFAWVIWFWLLITIFVIITPFIGVLIYMIAESKGMAERQAQAAQRAKSQTDDYIKTVAQEVDPAGQIAQAKSLLDSGAINQQEFDSLKARALAAS
jgi:predicted membrane protein